MLYRYYIILYYININTNTKTDNDIIYLFTKIHCRGSSLFNLLLQLKNSVKESLSRWRTSRNVNIHRDNPVAPSHNRIRIVIIPPTIGTTSHTNNPPRFRHLIINLPQSRSHFISKRPRHDHDITLPRRSPKNNPKPVLIVPRRGHVHHFDGTTGETESHGPE